MPRRSTREIITSLNEKFVIKEPSLSTFMKLQDKIAGENITGDGIIDLLEACVIHGPEKITREYLEDLDAITQSELLVEIQNTINLEKMELLQKKLQRLNK